ncbi:hypothetical protein MTO96_013961 [Rhipicephalus appendiculatus]
MGCHPGSRPRSSPPRALRGTCLLRRSVAKGEQATARYTNLRLVLIRRLTFYEALRGWLSDRASPTAGASQTSLGRPYALGARASAATRTHSFRSRACALHARESARRKRPSVNERWSRERAVSRLGARGLPGDWSPSPVTLAARGGAGAAGPPLVLRTTGGGASDGCCGAVARAGAAARASPVKRAHADESAAGASLDTAVRRGSSPKQPGPCAAARASMLSLRQPDYLSPLCGGGGSERKVRSASEGGPRLGVHERRAALARKAASSTASSSHRPVSASLTPPASLLAGAPLSAPPVRSRAPEGPQLAVAASSSSTSSSSSSAQVPGALHYPAYFVKGSIIQLGSGLLKKVEDLRTEDFVSSANLSRDLRIDSSRVLRVAEAPSKGDGVALLSFSVGQNQVQVTVEAPGCPPRPPPAAPGADPMNPLSIREPAPRKRRWSAPDQVAPVSERTT